MVRFLDEGTVIINDNSREPAKDFSLLLKTSLLNAGLNMIEIPTSIYDDSQSYDDATGDYLNYLHMKGIIFLPAFKRREDNKVCVFKLK
jgi:hypothetical protein